MAALCEWELDDTVRKLGMTAANAIANGVAKACERPASPPICWSHLVDDQLAYVCVLARDLCETTREAARRMTAPSGHTYGEPSPCAPWPYD